MLGYDWALIEGFMLAFLRTGTVVALMPVAGHQSVPPQLKMGFAFILALVMAPDAAQHIASAPPGLFAVATAALAEVLTGLIIGLFTALVLVGAEFAGAIVGVQIGFGMVQIMDPQFGENVSILGQLQYLLALMIFLILDYHLHILQALGESFRLIPLGGAAFPEQIAVSYWRLSAEVFVLAVKLASPVIAILLISEIALALVARIMPQMNVFFVGLPLKIGVGLLALSVSWSLFIPVLTKWWAQFEYLFARVITMLAG